MKTNEKKADMIPAFFFIFFILFIVGAVLLIKSL